MKPLIADPALPHQIVLRQMTGTTDRINVSCNCRRYLNKTGYAHKPIAIMRPELGAAPMLAAYAKAHR